MYLLVSDLKKDKEKRKKERKKKKICFRVNKIAITIKLGNKQREKINICPRPLNYYSLTK